MLSATITVYDAKPESVNTTNVVRGVVQFSDAKTYDFFLDNQDGIFYIQTRRARLAIFETLTIKVKGARLAAMAEAMKNPTFGERETIHIRTV